MPQLDVRWVYEVDCIADVTIRKGSHPFLSEATLISVATAIKLFSSCKQHGVNWRTSSAATPRQLSVELSDICTLQRRCIDAMPESICWNVPPSCNSVMIVDTKTIVACRQLRCVSESSPTRVCNFQTSIKSDSKTLIRNALLQSPIITSTHTIDQRSEIIPTCLTGLDPASTALRAASRTPATCPSVEARVTTALLSLPGE